VVVSTARFMKVEMQYDEVLIESLSFSDAKIGI